MLKKDRKRRNINAVGKDNYKFDYELERDIYYYLCCKHIKQKRLNAMSENVKFDSYMQWEQYIFDKCADYPYEKLIEFSKYLNQRIRNKKPGHEYLAIIGPIFFTIIATRLPEIIEELNKIISQGVSLLAIVFPVVVMCVLIILFKKFVFKIIFLIGDNLDDEYFFMDYKEIVDKIIIERAKEALRKL